MIAMPLLSKRKPQRACITLNWFFTDIAPFVKPIRTLSRQSPKQAYSQPRIHAPNLNPCLAPRNQISVWNTRRTNAQPRLCIPSHHHLHPKRWLQGPTKNCCTHYPPIIENNSTFVFLQDHVCHLASSLYARQHLQLSPPQHTHDTTATDQRTLHCTVVQDG